MNSIIQFDKNYGVVHNKDYFSFFGFTKKIGSNEIQRIDIYLYDELIDTIEANEFIQKIDDMYDVENQAFSYNLPTKYIGQKATISFKYHNSSKELLNSPYTLIDKNHEDFNEARFMHSLNEPLIEDLKNIYKPNIIGFLANKENLEDEEFVGYIKELIMRFPEVEVKGFCFTTIDQELLKKFNISNINFILISDIYQLTEKISLFIQTLNHHNLVPYLLKQDIYYIWFINNAYNSNLTIDDYNSNSDPYNFKYFNYKDNEKISNNFAINFRNKMNQNLDTTSLSKIIYFERVKYYLESPEFKNFLLKKS